METKLGKILDKLVTDGKTSATNVNTLSGSLSSMNEKQTLLSAKIDALDSATDKTLRSDVTKIQSALNGYLYDNAVSNKFSEVITAVDSLKKNDDGTVVQGITLKNGDEYLAVTEGNELYFLSGKLDETIESRFSSDDNELSELVDKFNIIKNTVEK